MDIIFVDIDGTILACEEGLIKPSDFTAYAIDDLKEKGRQVIIASGRPFCLLPKSVVDLKPSGFLLMNGADLYFNEEHLILEYMKAEDVLRLVDFVDRHNGIYYLETHDYIYTKDLKAKRHVEFAKEWQNEQSYTDRPYDVNKISMAMIVLNNEEDMKAAKDELGDIFDLRRHRFGLSYDVNIKGVSKGLAITKFVKDLKDVKSYAFGDGLNDLEMMEVVDVGVAMGNADQKVKEAALHITDDVMHDGFYKGLLKLELISPKKL